MEHSKMFSGCERSDHNENQKTADLGDVQREQQVVPPGFSDGEVVHSDEVIGPEKAPNQSDIIPGQAW